MIMLPNPPPMLESHHARCTNAEEYASLLRFTRDGDAALESWLGELCAKTATGIQRIVPCASLEALILGGGYGRGEGGVLKTEDGDASYNDLEFFVLIRGAPRLNERRYGKAIHDLGHRLTEESGLEVELKITSLASIRSSETTMFYYDLVCGHRVTIGPPDIFDGCEHHTQASRIPLHEATRLMMNRCSGLLYAQERLSRSPITEDEADFVYRNIAKAQLAMGDALLAANGQYHWSCIERHQRLKHLALRELADEMPLVIKAHASGVHFKLHPERCPIAHAGLHELHEKVNALGWTIWQWIEQRRLKRSFASPAQYAHDPASKCPETRRLKNALVRVMAFGPTAALRGDRWRYPRESLLRILPLLLWQRDSYSAESAALANRWLHRPAPTWNEAVEAYERLWCRFN